MSEFKINGHEYNEYVIGYIIHTSKGDVNAQFEKCHSNHPEPNYLLYIGCEGDETAEVLNEEEREKVMNYIRNSDEMDAAEKAYTKAIYSGMKYRCPLFLFEIEDYDNEENENS